MMANYKIDRICEDLKREITDILHIIKDPRVSNQILTIVNISLTRDMSFAKIYVSSLDGLSGANRAVEGLKSAKGLIKKEIGLRLKIRKIPELEFVVDNSVENTINMFKKLAK